jgi:hypothetical protein
VQIIDPGDDGVYVTGAGEDGFQVAGADGHGVLVSDTGGSGLRVENAGGSGVYIDGPAFSGVRVVSATTDGLRIQMPGEDGLHVSNATGTGVKVFTATNGLYARGISLFGVDAAGVAGGAYFQDTDSGKYAYIAYGLEGISTNGTKTFVEPHPADPTLEIYYAALEGGEAGTYCRGSAQLTEGTAVVDLPEHFSLVTEEEGLTVQVTPRGDCYGLYVAEATTDRIVVKELRRGRSSVPFDFMVNGVRIGYGDYQVIRPKRDPNPPPQHESESPSSQLGGGSGD